MCCKLDSYAFLAMTRPHPMAVGRAKFTAIHVAVSYIMFVANPSRVRLDRLRLNTRNPLSVRPRLNTRNPLSVRPRLNIRNPLRCGWLDFS